MALAVPPAPSNAYFLREYCPSAKSLGVEHAAIVRHEEIVGNGLGHARHRIEIERERPLGVLERVAHVAALDRLVWRHGTRQLDLAALLVGQLVHLNRGLVERNRVGRLLVAAGGEEPQARPDNRSAERAFEPFRDFRRTLGVVVRLERRLVGPRRVDERRSEAAREHVAALLGDGVDDAAGEAAVLGRDARGQDLRLLDRVLDIQVVGVAKQVVLNVHAVDQKDVVVAERAGNRQLSGIERVVGEIGRRARRSRRACGASPAS